ncbi:MAG: caspase family protein, partial [Bacteroidota bacterium]
ILLIATNLQPMSNRRIFALLVGIDKYQSPVPPLDGCVNDMRAMRDYLKRYAERKGIPIHLEVLENEQATRLNIVTKFEQHLTQANEDDIAFFYYSGHGSQEHAHELFWKIEEDRKNETLVCYDSRLPDGMDLADKETATLIDVVARKNPHIVVIMDACNTGGATRDIHSKARNVSQLPVRVRDPHSYILPRSTQQTRAVSFSPDASELVVPNPRHVVLSAAQSFELAKETYLGGTPRGVFTFSLLEILEKSVGPLSYSDLIRQVRSLVTKRTTDQNPQLYAPVEGDVHKEFLEGLTSVDHNYYALSHNDADGWHIDGGAIHGIMPPNFSGEATTLNVFAEDATEPEMRQQNMTLGQVIVTRVLSGKSIVTLQGDLWLDARTIYRAKIADLPITPVKFNMVVSRKVEKLLDERLASSTYYQNFIEKVDSVRDAAYTLHEKNNELLFSYASEGPSQPLVKQIAGTDERAVFEAVKQMDHMSQWQQIAEIANPGSGLPSNAIAVELMEVDIDMPILASMDGYRFEYDHSQGNEGFPRFRIRLTNRTNQRLYCGLLFLNIDFSSMTGLVGNNGGIYLDPGAQTWVGNGRSLNISVSDNFAQIGRREINSTFKVIFGHKEFNMGLLALPSLGEPVNRSVDSGKMSTRNLLFDSPPVGNFDDWNASDIPVQIVRRN